jgi:hypothetical protein
MYVAACTFARPIRPTCAPGFAAPGNRRSASEAKLCSRLFRLLLKLPTLELHSRRSLSYRR